MPLDEAAHSTASRAGSGKSTLLRILAGLIPPTSGQVLSNGAPVQGPNPDVAMVFQSFALLPWLTVQQNADFFLDLLLEHFPIAEAERQFATVVEWGRYAELFEYDFIR